MSANSTARRTRRKRTDRPPKPYPEFPLQPHASGHWSKRIRGRMCYFGKWGQRQNGHLELLPDGGAWRAALERYKAEIDDLQAGRIPRTITRDANDLHLAELLNGFLNHKQRQIESGELSPRTFREYKESCDLMIDQFGSRRLVDDLRPDDFEMLRAKMAKRWGPSRVGKFVQMIRTTFKYGVNNGLIEKPLLFGTAFKKPTKALMRKHKAARGSKLFAAGELRVILDALDGKEVVVSSVSGQQSEVKVAANPQLKAIVLLALNAGLGNGDISGLQFRHLDLDGGWLDYPRPKTGLPRRVPLWKETISAVRSHMGKRRNATDDADAECVFLNRAGRRLVQVHVNYSGDGVSAWAQDYVSSQFRSVLRAMRISDRKGTGFYSLRHTFATIGLQTGDRDAVRSLMGHATNDVLAEYDETGPSDERLHKVVAHVRTWLFGPGKKPK